MADYSVTVTVDLARAERMTQNTGLIFGEVSIDNYNSTLIEITGITRYFKATPRVINDGLSSNGYVVRWNKSSGAFEAYYPTSPGSHQHNVPSDTSGTTANAEINGSSLLAVAGGGKIEGNSSADAPGSEVNNDVTVGAVNFVAVGLI